MKKLLGVSVLCTLLLLAACGGGEEPTPEAAATVAATPTTEAVTETATPTPAVTETAGLTETESLTGTEEMIGTEEMTGTEGMSDTEAMTDTEFMTDTEGVTGAGALTETLEMTGTEGMSETAGISDSAGMEEAPRQLIRATDLQGYNVQNAAGESLGSVQDVVINLADGQILLVTLEYGGFLDIGDKVFPIPLSAFRFEQNTTDLVEPPLASDVAVTDTVGMTDTVEITDAAGLTDTGPVVVDTFLILDIPEETFQNAPGIEEDLNLTDPTTIGDVETFYRDLGEDVIGRPIAETDLESLTGNTVKLSDIQGGNVQNPAGEGVGEVNDMLIDLRAARVEYFILEFGGFLGIGDNEYAIPMDAFEVIPTSADVEAGFPTLVLDVTEEQLETAPVFDAAILDAPDWDVESRSFWLQNGN